MFEKSCPKCGTKLIKQTYVSGSGLAPFGVASPGGILKRGEKTVCLECPKWGYSERKKWPELKGRVDARAADHSGPLRFAPERVNRFETTPRRNQCSAATLRYGVPARRPGG